MRFYVINWIQPPKPFMGLLQPINFITCRSCQTASMLFHSKCEFCGIQLRAEEEEHLTHIKNLLLNSKSISEAQFSFLQTNLNSGNPHKTI